MQNLTLLISKTKSKKSSFLGEREREISLQISHVSFSFLRYFLCFPLPLPTHTESTNPDVHKNTSLGIATSHAMHVQQEKLPCCRCTGIPRDQLLSCKVMYKLRCRDSRETEHALYFCTGKASWTEPSLGALKMQKLSAYKKMLLLTGSSGHKHLRSL